MSNGSNAQYHRFGDGACHCIHRDQKQPLLSKDPPDPLRTMPLGNSAPGVHLERQAASSFHPHCIPLIDIIDIIDIRTLEFQRLAQWFHLHPRPPISKPASDSVSFGKNTY